MENITIKVLETVGCSLGVDPRNGQRIFDLISKQLRDKKKVSVSFQKMEVFTISFLNLAIAQLYRDFSESVIVDHLEIADLSDSEKVKLKRVIDRVKLDCQDSKDQKRSLKKYKSLN